MSEQKEEPKKIISCKFEGVFPDLQSEALLKEYTNLINILCNLSKENNYNDFYLSTNIAKTIIGEKDPIIDFCQVKDNFSFFNICLIFEYNGIQRTKAINLRKKEYEILYQNKKYYCFEMNSLREYLYELLTYHKYYIEISSDSYSKKRIRDIEQFLMLNSCNFKILVDYQFNDIDYNNFDYDSIYKISDKITGPKLNLKLGHYVSLTEDDFNNFIYYDTEERKQFYKEFQYILGYRKEFGFCGPYGTGKTITMLKMVISNINQKYLYINLGAVNDLYIDELKKLLRYEITKLFGKDVILSENKNLVAKKVYVNIVELIENLKDKNIFELLKNIILEIKKFKCMQIFFIIDQYSSKYDIDNNLIKEIIRVNDRKNYIIICSSMNNDCVKNYLYQCLNEKTVFPSYSIDFAYYFYVGSLIRLNNLSNYEEIIKGEPQEFVRYLNYFGNIPLYYYLLKKAKNEKGEFNFFIYNEKETIIKEIKNFYSNNQKKNVGEESYQMIIDILKIMTIINKKEIFFFDDLSEAILKFPLKFLEIKKETIKINDLKLYGLASNNTKINDFIKDVEKNNLKNKIEEDQYILSNYVRFFNEDKYCFNYISRLTEKKKKKYFLFIYNCHYI